MTVTIKSQDEIALMREAGRILSLTHQELERSIRPGMSTMQIDQIGEEIIRSYGCIPSFKNYEGYPASICVSVNDEVVHGIPNSKHILRDGDIVSLDAGVIYKGYHSDAARTVAVGEISDTAQTLIDVTRQSFFEGIKMARAGNHIKDIGTAIQTYVEKHGFSVVRDLTGHGIGTQLHEKPDVPNFRTFRRGIKLKPGMTLAVEPMVNEGAPNVWWSEDDWTVVTADGLLSAHYENTIVITEDEPEILSL
jgi:methionyl aminopeptidase